jgi:hypothetical protein
MRLGSSIRFTLWSGATSSSYRSWERVIGAARLAAAESGAGVRIVDDASGAMWDVSPSGRAVSA